MGEAEPENARESTSRMRRLLAAITPRDLGGALATGVVCGGAPFLAACYGYGGYVRISWPLALLAMPMVGLFVWSWWSLLRGMYRLVRGRLPEPGEPWWRWPNGLAVLLVSWLSFFVGWGAGRLARDAHCRRIRARCEPLLAALDAYSAGNGVYPETLAAIPDVERLRSDAGVTIREGLFLEYGIDVSVMDGADAAVYLDRDGYVCIVPIEHRVFMSFTRFYVYARGSRDNVWRRDHLIWHLSSMGQPVPPRRAGPAPPSVPQ